MKIVRFTSDGRFRYGVLDGETVKVVKGSPFRALDYSGEGVPLSGLRLLAPCVPSKIAALGVNYRLHGKELKMKVPQEPLLFLKPSTAVIGPEDRIIYPDMSRHVDYEGELGVVIGKRARNISREDTPQYILGYTCCNDVTARDLQTRDEQWTRAKGFDTFAPIGPWIETDLDPGNVTIEALVNGTVKQQGNTRDLIFDVFDLVSFISRVMTLLPGDVIATGTPPGVGPIQKGDSIEIRIEHIGTLRNYVA